MAKRKAKKSEPTVFEQMTAARARAVMYVLYAADVCGEAHLEAIAVRDALKTPERFAKPGKETGDTWGVYGCECDPVEMAEPEPAREHVSYAEQLRRDDAWRDIQEAHCNRYAGKPETWPSAQPERACDICGDHHPASDHVHSAISAPLNGLPDGHDLIGPLERADDARSAWMCLYRWSHALAYHWGMDTRGYWRAVSAAYNASQRPQKVAA